MESISKKRTPSIVNLTVKRRYLTQREIERLMDCARKHGRYGHRDATMILVAYRHGLRASEICDLQWQQIELSEGRLHVHRVKSGIPSVHPIRGDEMRALRKLRRDYPRDAHVFVWARSGRSIPASGRLCRSHPQGREAHRVASPGADQIRTRDQSQDCQDARPRNSADAARRRGRVAARGAGAAGGDAGGWVPRWCNTWMFVPCKGWGILWGRA